LTIVGARYIYIDSEVPRLGSHTPAVHRTEGRGQNPLFEDTATNGVRPGWFSMFGPAELGAERVATRNSRPTNAGANDQLRCGRRLDRTLSCDATFFVSKQAI